MGFESSSQGLECGDAKPSKIPSNIYEIVPRYAKVCKLRSMGVLGARNQNPANVENVTKSEESSCNGSEENKCDGKTAHTQLSEVLRGRNPCDHIEISKLFDTLSVLKLAYVKLQEAHLPYDHDKIRGANDIVVAQLESLCRMKQAYKEKKLKKVNLNPPPSCSVLLEAEIQVRERILENLKCKVKDKEDKVLNLRRELEDLELQCKRLAEKCWEIDKESIKLGDICSFEQVVGKVEMAIHDFAKPLIALMKVSGWDLNRAVNSIESSVVYAKRSHKKYAFDAYIARRMFHGFSFQSQNTHSIREFDDPMSALIEDPRSSFARFCGMKYLLVVHPKMEASFFGNVDIRRFVANGLHPQTPFYRAFVKMARWVWTLQAACSSIMADVNVFTVKRGSKFSHIYMDSIDELKENPFTSDPWNGGFKVEFMILPGFQIGHSLIKSRVYVSKAGF